MNKLKIKFVDFWPRFNSNTDPIFGKFLNKYFIIGGSEDPNIVIFSVFGNQHKKYSK